MISTMFKPQAGSPSTDLSADITDSDKKIPLIDASVLPDGPNIVTLSANDQFESVIYQSKDEANNKLIEVTRGIEGTAQSWASGTEVARNFTARDLETIQSLLRELYYDSTFTNDESTAIKVFTTPTINPTSMDVHAYYDSIDIDLIYNNADKVTEVNIAGDFIIDPSYWSVSNGTLTIDTEPLLTYELNNSISSFDINIVFNENFTTNTLSANMIDDGYKTDEGQILTETTLA